jgi:dihydroflavonol-4-reductase
VKVFITGATGQIGRALAEGAVAAGHSVRCLVRDPGRAEELRRLPVELVVGELPSPTGLIEGMRGCEVVLHAAGVVSYLPAKAAQMRAVNVDGTRVMLEAARAAGVRRFVFTSSIAALGRVPEGKLGDEETVWNWEKAGSAYLETKRDAHRLVLAATGIETLTLCPGIVFGSGDVHENGLRLVRQVWEGRLPGVPCGSTTAVGLSDVVDAHLAAMEAGVSGRAYVLGSFVGPFADLVERVGQVVQRPVPRRRLPFWALWGVGALQEMVGGMRGVEPPFTRALAWLSSSNRQYRSDRAAEELGFRPQPIEVGIADAFRWAQQTGRLT